MLGTVVLFTSAFEEPQYWRSVWSWKGNVVVMGGWIGGGGVSGGLESSEAAVCRALAHTCIDSGTETPPEPCCEF